MNRIKQALILGEQVADLLGDVDTWRYDFEKFRERNGILDSLRLSLLNQGLWSEFEKRCDPQFLKDYFSTTKI